MKFYETHTEDYILSVERYNIHPELSTLYKSSFPKSLKQFDNMIVYGPSGSGKYSQVLYFLKNYSPSKLKYEKKMTIQNDKHTYIYHISDIHYEIDMAFLGCNSKLLWHDIFLQIVDIISVKQEKIGIIVCKNFHMIHSELLEIFYSYIHHYNNENMNIKIKFIILSDHISFLPNNILNICVVLPIKKPNQTHLQKMISSQKVGQNKNIISEIEQFQKRISSPHVISSELLKNTQQIINQIENNNILNLKEIRSFNLIKDIGEIPPDIFNIICDEIIQSIENKHKLHFTNFRDLLYNILIYNLEVVDCVWYIFIHFINNEKLKKEDISSIIEKTYLFLKYFNNNYRPIYHLESIMFYITSKLHNYDDNKRTSITNS